MLNLLNDILEEKNTKIASKYKDEKYPIYFIIAQPRGASALLQQLLISNLDIGYISNFLAKFYKSPLFGMELEKGVLDKKFKSSFLSNYGNTSGLNEPHEWGWFFKEHLNLKGTTYYTQKEEFSSLKSNLLAITNTKQLPLIIDNVYAMSNILKFAKDFSNIRIINMTRDLYFICNSIINARLSRYSDINEFYGHPPENIEDILKIKNPIEQIVCQVKSIQDETNNIMNNFDNKNIMHIDYEDIYNNSFAVVEKFHTFVQKDDINLNYKEKHTPKLTYRNDKSLIKDEYKDDLDFYYKKYFGTS